MAHEDLARLWGGDEESLGNLGKKIAELPEKKPDPIINPTSEFGGGTLIWGRDLVPFYADPEKDIEIFEERKKDAEGIQLPEREFVIQHGIVKFVTSIATNSKQGEKEFTLSFERSNYCGTLVAGEGEQPSDDFHSSEDSDTTYGDGNNPNRSYNISSNDFLRLTGYDLPRLLFPNASVIDPERLQNMTHAYVKNRGSKYPKDLWLVRKADRESFRNMTNDPLPLESVEMRTILRIEGYEPYSFHYKYKKNVFDRSDFRIIMPLSYEWNAQTLEFALDNHREIEINPHIRSSSNPQYIADGLNYITSRVLESSQ